MLLLTVGQAIAQEKLFLVCNGHIKLTTDISKIEQKFESVEVLVDFPSSAIEIKGNWGCFSDLDIAREEKSKCFGSQTAVISESKIAYLAKSESTKYPSETYFIINRYSGVLSIDGTAFANPSANASWGLRWSSGKMQCTSQNKKF